MNPVQHQVHTVVRAVLQSVAKAPEQGVTVGEVFLASQAHFSTFRQFQSLMGCLTVAGTIRQCGDMLWPTDSGSALLSTIGQPAPACSLAVISPCFFEGEWSHLFGPGRAETRCRIIVDVRNDKLIAAMAFDGSKWADLSVADMADLAESLFGANEISASPEDWGLSLIESLPAWASSCEAVAPIRLN